jgi:hypothetical protein
MPWGKDVERLARAFVKQHLDLEYIRYYLMEHFQLDRKTCDQMLEKIGAYQPPQPGGKGPVKPEDKDKVRRQGFF